MCVTSVINEGSLDYLIEVIESTLFGQDVYQEVYHKAGLYFYQIVAGHIFQDGNKRTGNQTSLIFLSIRRWPSTVHCRVQKSRPPLSTKNL